MAMDEIYETEYEGWQITVWMVSNTIWSYIATKENEYRRGTVVALNRIDAAQAVKEIL